MEAKIMKADLVIAGAGPAGLFAAIQAAENNENKKIIILEKNSSAGKKLLISGSGQCNLTHAGEIANFFNHYGNNYNFLLGSLYTFDNKMLMNFFENRGVEFRKAREGKIFPKSNEASDILNVLLKEAKSKNIKIIYNTTIKKVNYNNKLFEIKSENKIYK